MKENINPIYDQWIEKESEWILQNAQNELSTILNTDHERNAIPPHHTDNRNKNSNNNTTDPIDIGASAFALGGATIIATMSTAPAWGILGVIGFTAVSWPAVIAGGGLVALGGFIGFGTEVYKKHIKEKIKNEVCMKILGCEKCNTSVRMILEDRIFETAKKLLSEYNI